ncbi:MAG: PIG-L deacetylase family protein [Planctomycetota bacterium]
MNERAPLPEPLARPPHGRVLVLAPHPDDDVLGPGGTAALHAAQGDSVHVVILGNGQAGDARHRYAPAEYTAIRHAEALAGGAHLGLESYEFWDYPEGFHPSPEIMGAAARRMAAVVKDRAIEIVYAPWAGEHHIDHHFVARAARIALVLAGFRGEAWGYEVWTPLVATRIVDISSVYARKMAALLEHKSQIEHVDIVHTGLAISAQRSIYLPRDAKHGEAFAPLGPPAPEDLPVLEACRRAE